MPSSFPESTETRRAVCRSCHKAAICFWIVLQILPVSLCILYSETQDEYYNTPANYILQYSGQSDSFCIMRSS